MLGVWSSDYIPKGTRFGPLRGARYRADQAPEENRKYLWRVYRPDESYEYVDAYDVSRANWMRFVCPAFSSAGQNLVACQVNGQIYFYTVRAVLPGQELLVWYCREFAQRLNFPFTGELILQQLRKSCLRASPSTPPLINSRLTFPQSACSVHRRADATGERIGAARPPTPPAEDGARRPA